jgi:hypothetical protein
MLDGRMRDGKLTRAMKMGARAAALCLLPLVSGCLPGYNWGSDDSSSEPQASSQAPALNRSFKTNFLSLQMPSIGSSNLQGQLMPDSGPSFFNAFSTIEERRGGSPATPVAYAPVSPVRAEFEAAVLPASKSLANFYAALAALASGRRTHPVTILHFGDDHIADDRFAGALRDHLVNRFGNAGRGLMTPGLYPIRGVKVDRGGQWNLASAAGNSPGPFSITGARMISASSEAWLRLTSAQAPFDWIEVTFLTGPGMGTAIVSIDGDPRLVPANAPMVTETPIRFTSRAREVLIKPKGDGQVAVLSIATGSNAPGILYSNLGLPGSTALTPGKWSPDFAANELRKWNPDLILLEYGSHEGFDDALDVKGYEERLRMELDQIKAWAPQASVLVVGPPDAARLPSFATSAGAQICRALNGQEIAAYPRIMANADERLGRWHAPPELEAVRSAQRRVAAASGAFYWDWSKYMGGPCSVHAWASFQPPLAAPDHVTLTEAGDERSARALFAEVMAGYDAYQRSLQAQAQAMATAAAPVKPAHPQKKRAARAQ